MSNATFKLFSPCTATIFLLVAAYIALPKFALLNPFFQELAHYAPYAIITFAGLLSLRFGRSRVVYILSAIGLAYLGTSFCLENGRDNFTAKVVFHATSILLPLNLLIFIVLREKKLLSFHGILRFGFILLQVAVTAWAILTKQESVIRFLTQDIFSNHYFPKTHVSQLTIIIMVLGFVFIGVSIFFKNTPIKNGFLGVLIAVFFACNFAGRANHFPVYISVACIIFTISLIQDSHNMAYLDELTGLLTRRALNEYMKMLGRRYTIAMLDVDYFKKFNDTFGHDMGDQVLRMVGSKIGKVRGGGKAYRYGGEEFTVIFPRKEMKQVATHLEELRQSIEKHKFIIRGKGRPKKSKRGKKERGKQNVGRKVSVSISIGVAERCNGQRTPDDVIRAADKALYKAKKMGRNKIVLSKT
ncbi:MAG: GGDEF domain-containing protein [Planctomycetota bacterium]